MDEHSQRRVAPVSALDEEFQPQATSLAIGNENGACSQQDQSQARDSMPPTPPCVVELSANHGSPMFDSCSEETVALSTAQRTISDNDLVAAFTQVDGHVDVTGNAYSVPYDSQSVDDVPLLDLGADISASPLIQTSLNSETNSLVQSCDEDGARFELPNVNTTQSEIFAKIYTDSVVYANDNEDHDAGVKDKNCCDVCFGKSCHVVCNYGSRISMRPMLTKRLVLGRNIGWDIFRSIVFPLVCTTSRRLWIASMWLPALVLISLSLAMWIEANGTEIHNIVSTVLCGILVLYCLIDTVSTEVCNFKIGNKTANRNNQLLASEAYNNSDDKRGARKWQKFENHLDLMRLIVPELILVPIVACDVYSLVVFRSYSGQSTDHVISFVKFLVSSVTHIIQSHVIPLAVTTTVVHRLHTQRTPPVELVESDPSSNSTSHQPLYDFSPRQAGLRYGRVFAVHVVLQIVNQAVLVLALGFKLHDYVSWIESFNYDPDAYFHEISTIKVEVALFMVGAYILPIAGFWIFFIVSYYWAQEFLVGLTVDFVGMLRLPGASQHFFRRVVNGDDKICEILEHVDFDNLKRDYSDLSTKSFIDKGLYPFRNCMLALLCTVYSILQIVYLTFAVIDIKNRPTVAAAIYIFTAIIEVVSSLSAYIVGVFWILFFWVVLLILCGMCLKQLEPSTQYHAVRPYSSYPIQQQYVSRRPQFSALLRQPVTVQVSSRLPTPGQHHPNLVASRWPAIGHARGEQVVVQQNRHRSDEPPCVV